MILLLIKVLGVVPTSGSANNIIANDLQLHIFEDTKIFVNENDSHK